MSELLLKRVDELRAEKQRQQELKELQIQEQKEKEERLRIQQEQELTDAKVTWEAQMILQTEELTQQKIIQGFTDDKVPESYTQSIVTQHFGHRFNNIHRQHVDKHRQRMMVEEATFKQNYIHDYIFNTVQPIYQQRQEKIKRDAEEKEQLRRQTLLDTLNERVKTKILSNAKSHTFTDLTMCDYDAKVHINTDNYSQFLKKEYLVQSTDNSWRHFNCDTRPHYIQHKMGTIYDMPSSWITYYEEGKVPFCTKCPVCNNPTKLNYLVNIYNNGFGLSDSHKDGTFIEVYCDKHYKYDCETGKHYKMDLRGKQYNCRIRSKYVENPNLLFRTGHSTHKITTIWDPTGKWLEWDPTDPDSLERKQKEIEDITKQIADLQTKLAFLKS